MEWVYLFSAGLAFVLSLFFTPILGYFARLHGWIDDPTRLERKIHKQKTPLSGGVSIFLSFLLITGYFLFFTDQFASGHILQKHLIGVIIGGLILFIGGYLDDKWSLPSWIQILFPILATLSVILFGVGITYITNPLGGLVYFDQYKTSFFLFGQPFTITWLADIFAGIWILVMIYTIKLLDGLDGLATGVSGIGFFIIFALSVVQGMSQSSEALLSIILVGGCLGFLVFNMHPAKIFLGEGGSTFLGFMLGVLAIISGGKIATALLVLGIPLLDLIWVIIRRVLIERRSPFTGDKKHFHHRLLETGLSYKQVVYTYYFFAFIFGMTTLFLQSAYKIGALILLVIVMSILGSLSIWIYHKKKALNSHS